MLTINGHKYRGIKKFSDRHGKLRYYLRASGAALPNPEQVSPHEFDEAYLAAIQAHKNGWQRPTQIKVPKEFRGAKARPKLPPLLTTVAIGPHQHAGVYLLFHKGTLIYIGQSANMPKRVKEHAANGRPFDRAYFIKTAIKERFAVESALIAALSPPQNRTQK